MNAGTDFLFAEPSFLEGVARILDFGNTLSEYNRSPSPEIADELALWLDWSVTGIDIAEAVSIFGYENPEVEVLA